MNRAGIPVHEAAKHKDTTDLKATGIHRRTALVADQTSGTERRWQNEPTPWAYIEATYLEGADQ